MKPRQQVSRAAIELIKRFEGCRSRAAQLPDGRWTIGHGHTLTARQGAEVSADDAEALLLYDLIAVSFSMNEWVYAPLTQNQFDALCAFAFNIGLDEFRRSSVLKRVNEGALLQAAYGMELWRKADFESEQIVVDALVRRRAAEKALFLTPPQDAWVPAPSPELKPRYDRDGEALIPAKAPVDLFTTLKDDQVVVQRTEPVGAPQSAEKPASPIQAAAEAVTARLQVLFQETADPAAAEAAEAAEQEAPALSEPVQDVLEPAEAPEEPPPKPAPVHFPGPALGIPARKVEAPMVEQPPVEAPPAVDSEAAPSPLEDAEIAAALEPEPFDPIGYRPDGESEPEPVVEAEAEFAPEPELIFEPEVEREAAEPDAPALEPTNVPEAVVLAIVGMVFFAGGLFWALNAHPGVQMHPANPLLVGWLAGVAGVGFMAIAVYLLLDNLGRAAQRTEKRKPGSR